MERKLKGIALIAFGILFYAVSGELQESLWRWHIGVSIPWELCALALGVACLLLAFQKNPDTQKGDH